MLHGDLLGLFGVGGFNHPGVMSSRTNPFDKISIHVVLLCVSVCIILSQDPKVNRFLRQSVYRNMTSDEIKRLHRFVKALRNLGAKVDSVDIKFEQI